MRKKQRRMSGALSALVTPLIALAALLCFFTALSNLDSGRTEEGRRQLETSLRRAAVACYAAEGIYPPTLDYLEEHYGLQIDEGRYAVFYEIFADNLMPNITVLDKET